MSVLPIRTVPDDILRTVCDPVTAFDATLETLTSDMFETMYAAPGRGLAAPQIGRGIRVFIMDAKWKEGMPSPMIFVNPEILSVSETVETLDEGCLSIPGQLSSVTRPAQVGLRWQSIDGATQEGTFDGFAAACVQHELDHLNGVLCTDYQT